MDIKWIKFIEHGDVGDSVHRHNMMFIVGYWLDILWMVSDDDGMRWIEIDTLLVFVFI